METRTSGDPWRQEHQMEYELKNIRWVMETRTSVGV